LNSLASAWPKGFLFLVFFGFLLLMDDLCNLINFGFDLLVCQFSCIGIKKEVFRFHNFLFKEVAILMAVFIDLTQLWIQNQLRAEHSRTPALVFFYL